MSTSFWLSVLIVAVAYQVVSALVRYAVARPPQLKDDPAPAYNEAVLFGPVSAWVAEGEARAVHDWEAKHPPPKPRIPPAPDCDDCEWAERQSLDQEFCDFIRTYACDKHGGRLPNAEPPADISDFKMVWIR